MSWHTGKPQKGPWLVIDRAYRHMHLASYTPGLRYPWHINGRHYSDDWVICWHEPPAWPRNLDALAKPE